MLAVFFASKNAVVLPQNKVWKARKLAGKNFLISHSSTNIISSLTNIAPFLFVDAFGDIIEKRKQATLDGTIRSSSILTLKFLLTLLMISLVWPTSASCAQSVFQRSMRQPVSRAIRLNARYASTAPPHLLTSMLSPVSSARIPNLSTATSASDEYEDVVYYEEVYEDVEESSKETAAQISVASNSQLQQQQTDSLFSSDAQKNPSNSDAQAINSFLSKGSTIPQGYDWRVRPPGTNLTLPGNHGPVIVKVDMLIRSISKIDDVNMEYSVQLTFRESWVDGRLAFGLPNDNTTPPFVILTAGQHIWMPDSFFQNEKQAQKHMIDKPNVLIRVHKDGVILYSVRISLVLSCPMHLQYYPMDVQTCLIDLASYAYTTEDIEYEWKAKDPVQLKSGLESSLPSFQLGNVNTTYCTSNTNTGIYSCLRTVLQLKRQFSYYLLQLYIPSTMLVIVSWVSFWLDRTAVPARVTLGVTTLLTMTTQASGINAKLPPVSYSKAIDIWCGACLTFIFGALLEFACVTYMASRMFYKAKARPASIIAGGNSSFNTNLQTSTGLSLAAPSAALVTHNASFTPNLKTTHLTNCGSIQTIGEEEEIKLKEEDKEDVWVRQFQPLPQLVLRREARKEEQRIDLEMAKKEPSPPLCSPLQPTIYIRRRSSAIGLLKRWCPGWRWVSKQLDIEDRAKRADYISRIMFPLAFILFNLVYWLRYSRYEISWPWSV